MQLDQGLCERQSQTGALGRLGVLALNLFKRKSQSGKVLLGNADPVVADRDPDPIAHRRSAELTQHRHPAAPRGELYGIGKKVEQNLLDRPVIPLDVRQRRQFNANLQPGRLCSVANEADCVLGDLFQGDRLELEVHLAGLDFRHVEDVVDQGQKMLPAAMNIACVFLVAGVAHRAIHLVLHDLREAIDGVQRGSQFVGHVGQKLAL